MSKKTLHSLYLVLITLFPLFLMGGGLFFCSYSTGFSIDKITSRLSYNERWEIEPLSDEEKQMLRNEIFSQTFFYLASSSKMYAFISQDQKYVLKFFKMQNLFPQGWTDSFPLSLLRALGFKKEEHNELFSERIFASYQDAYTDLSEETGLLYIHLNKTHELKMKTALIDSKGKKHLVDLDRVEFVVQKRAHKIYDYLNRLVREKKWEDLKLSICSILRLIATRCEKGFIDEGLNIRNNFGFVGNTAIQMDCSRLTRDSSVKYPLNYREKIREMAEHLDAWAQDYYPEITLVIQEESQKIINNLF